MKGKVKISSEEYRELITEITELRRYKVHTDRKNLEDRLKLADTLADLEAVKAELAEYKEFFKAFSWMQKDFEEFVSKRKEGTEEDEQFV